MGAGGAGLGWIDVTGKATEGAMIVAASKDKTDSLIWNMMKEM